MNQFSQWYFYVPASSALMELGFSLFIAGYPYTMPAKKILTLKLFGQVKWWPLPLEITQCSPFFVLVVAWKETCFILFFQCLSSFYFFHFKTIVIGSYECCMMQCYKLNQMCSLYIRLIIFDLYDFFTMFFALLLDVFCVDRYFLRRLESIRNPVLVDCICWPEYSPSVFNTHPSALRKIVHGHQPSHLLSDESKAEDRHLVHSVLLQGSAHPEHRTSRFAGKSRQQWRHLNS